MPVDLGVLQQQAFENMSATTKFRGEVGIPLDGVGPALQQLGIHNSGFTAHSLDSRSAQRPGLGF